MRFFVPMRLVISLLVLCFGVPVASQTNPVIDDNFNRSNTSAGTVTGPSGAAGQTYASPSTGGAYTDVSTSTWFIGSNYLQAAIGSISNPQTRLLRPAAEAWLNSKIVITTRPITSATESYCAYLREQTSGIGLYARFQLYTGTNLGFVTYGWHNASAGGVAQIGQGTNYFQVTSGHQYVLTMSVTGASPSTVTATIADLSAPTTILTSVTGANTGADATTNSAGTYGVGVDGTTAGGAASAISGIARLQTFNDGTGVTGLAAGTVTQTSLSSSSVTLTSAVASGGTGPYTYQWYKSTTPGFTPGSGNAISGATSLTLTDSPSSNAVTFYILSATDSTSPTPSVAYSAQIPVVLLASPYPTISLGFAGDSITGFLGTSGTYFDSPAQVTLKSLQRMTGGIRTVNMNSAVVQSVAGTKSADWVSGGTYLPSAKTAWAAQGVTVVQMMIGSNDCSAGVTPATFGANLASFCNDLVSSGYKVILHYSPYRTTNSQTNYTTDQENALLLQYQAQIDSLCNGTTILQGDRSAFIYFASHTGDLTDGLHPAYTGVQFFGQVWATADAKALGITSTSSVGVKRRVQGADGILSLPSLFVLMFFFISMRRLSHRSIRKASRNA